MPTPTILNELHFMMAMTFVSIAASCIIQLFVMYHLGKILIDYTTKIERARLKLDRDRDHDDADWWKGGNQE